MTEYDYSEEGYRRYMETQQRISRWVKDTNSHSDEYKSPFGARSDISTEDLVFRSLNHSPAPKSTRSRPHEYHGSTSGGGSTDPRRSKSVHRSSRRRSGSESTYYDPDGPGPMPMPAPTFCPSRAAVPAIPPQKLSQLVGTINRSRSLQSHSRHSPHGHRPDTGSTATRGLTQAPPTQPRNIARSSSLPRPFPHNDSVALAHDHGLPHHSTTSNSRHRHHNDGHHHHQVHHQVHHSHHDHHHSHHDHHHHSHHDNHHHHHHHHHHRRPRSRSSGPSISHSHSKGSGTTYEISSPTFIAPALGTNGPVVVPFRHGPGEHGYYPPDEVVIPGPGYTIIPKAGTMVKVML